MRGRRRIWTERECVACGTAFAFDPVAVRKRTPLALGEPLFACEPGCPECGCLPPAVVAGRKRGWHLLLTLGWAAPSAVMALTGFLSSATLLTYSAAGLVVGTGAALVLLAHAAVAFGNPNRNLARNLRRTGVLEALDELEALSEPDEELADGVPRAVSVWAVPLLLTAGAAALLAFAPFALRTASKWPTNPGTKPEVVGPGDTVRVWFPDHVEAVSGYWNGTPQAELDAGVSTPVPATAAKTTWGRYISGKSVKNSRTSLWADVTLPDDPALAGRTVLVRVDMTVQYPTDVGGGFVDRSAGVSTAQTFTLADRMAGTAYHRSYVLACLGALLVAACGFGLWLTAGRVRNGRPRRR